MKLDIGRWIRGEKARTAASIAHAPNDQERKAEKRSLRILGLMEKRYKEKRGG